MVREPANRANPDEPCSVITPVFHNPTLEALAREPAYTRAEIEAIAGALDQHRTLRMTPLATGLYPASSAAQGASTGYHRVWVRDNVFVAWSLQQAGRTAAAAATARALMAFYAKHQHRFRITGETARQQPQARPHIRFDGERLEELASEPWSHAQNDALGYCLWFCARLGRTAGLDLTPGELEVLAAIAQYFAELRYWEDEDSGHWEETRKRSASSIGVVVAGLQEWTALLRDGAAGLDAASRAEWRARAADAMEAGLRALAEILPSDCIQASPLQRRRYDAALLFLVYPLNVVRGEMADRVIDDIRSHLQGEVGIRRYLGDSYWAPDYDTRLPPEDWTRDFSHDIEVRNRLLPHIGDEAQWCLFDPILSALYGQRALETGSDEDRRLQAVYFNRSLAQVTADWQCPELYYLKGGRFTVNPHTPLLWTQANLQIALAMLRATADR
jgi:phosphorylase kinase alpha/beta subunit